MSEVLSQDDIEDLLNICGTEPTFWNAHGDMQVCCPVHGNNLIGNKYKMLTVIRDTGKRYKDGSILWDCLCDCGNHVELTSDRLRHTVSCGCFRKIKDRKYNRAFKIGENVMLYDSKGKYTIIDYDDYDKVKGKYWFVNNHGYVVSVTGTKHKTAIRLHNFIFDGEIPTGYEIDHKNRKKWDNRKSNLRLATRSQNNINRDVCKSNSSGYTGVSYMRSKQKWRAYITVNNKQIYLGLYNSVEEAYRVRVKAEKKYYGKFSSIGEGR